MNQTQHQQNNLSHYFSKDYESARERFTGLVHHHQGKHLNYEIMQDSPNGNALTIDVAHFGASDAENLLILSSGTHGVEGFFGSAVQLATIDLKLSQILANPNCAVLMIHAVNPYGFAHLRRVNEDNIDLNRNFMTDEDRYEGAPQKYAEMDPLLNPPSPPQAMEFFWIKSISKIIRHGFSALKSSVAQGQYEFPKGLFFGGKGASKSQHIISQNLRTWVGEAQQVIHLDLHTGLGKWGTYVMAASSNIPYSELEWLMSHFDQDKVQSLNSDGVLYTIRGEFTYFCRSLFPNKAYYPILVEFGTYPVLKVLYALREENRATHWCKPQDPRLDQARSLLKETFAPANTQWQQQVVESSLRVVDQASLAFQ